MSEQYKGPTFLERIKSTLERLKSRGAYHEPKTEKHRNWLINVMRAIIGLKD